MTNSADATLEVRVVWRYTSSSCMSRGGEFARATSRNENTVMKGVKKCEMPKRKKARKLQNCHERQASVPAPKTSLDERVYQHSYCLPQLQERGTPWLKDGGQAHAHCGQGGQPTGRGAEVRWCGRCLFDRCRSLTISTFLRPHWRRIAWIARLQHQRYLALISDLEDQHRQCIRHRPEHLFLQNTQVDCQLIALNSLHGGLEEQGDSMALSLESKNENGSGRSRRFEY
ncbi:hypothetical protein SCHPADRAFT_899935 [Schizopora paradoxa]|uniref:Uncharacterized protein n=1 Tax=Schizopora paradoxa TaxID=27342 RepID=A0A0H2S8W8_9AGAM|nr:hypothetical protein SCHPADRAFT_899935 [Schizopora paradoxa]